MMDKVQIYSNRVICCAQEETTDTYTAKFVICDFSVNENRRQLNQDTIKNWMGTLVNKPLVGKIVTTSKGSDFTGHILLSIEDIVKYCPLRLVTLEAFRELKSWYERFSFIDLEPSLDNPETEFILILITDGLVIPKKMVGGLSMTH